MVVPWADRTSPGSGADFPGVSCVVPRRVLWRRDEHAVGAMSPTSAQGTT